MACGAAGFGPGAAKTLGGPSRAPANSTLQTIRPSRRLVRTVTANIRFLQSRAFFYEDTKNSVEAFCIGLIRRLGGSIAQQRDGHQQPDEPEHTPGRARTRQAIRVGLSIVGRLTVLRLGGGLGQRHRPCWLV